MTFVYLRPTASCCYTVGVYSSGVINTQYPEIAQPLLFVLNLFKKPAGPNRKEEKQLFFVFFSTALLFDFYLLICPLKRRLAVTDKAMVVIRIMSSN